MDEKFRKSLEENGTDVDTVLKRFLGNEAMYIKFLVKFIDDKNIERKWSLIWVTACYVLTAVIL